MTAVSDAPVTTERAPVRIVREPLTYSLEGRESYFRDLALAAIRHDDDARDRLARHAAEMRVEYAARDALDEQRASSLPFGTEMRVNPNAFTAGQGAEFAPPIYLTTLFAGGSRAGRPLGDLLNPLPLPPGVAQINIPRMTPGQTTATQTDGTATSQTDIVTTNVQAQVCTIAGQSLISQQLFDQAPLGFDYYAYRDLDLAYNRALEAQLLTGSGTAGQLLGLTNVAGINTQDGSTATTFPLFWPMLGKAGAAIGNNRNLPPQAWLWATRRWLWVTSQLDAQGRAMVPPGNNGPNTTDLDPQGGAAPVGPVMGFPVYLDGAIPGGATADVVYCIRPSDMFLFESAPRTIAAVNATAAGANLQIVLSYHRYVAFVPHRYPAGIAVITGLPQPAGY